MSMNKKQEFITYNSDTHHLGLYVKEARLRHGYRLAEAAQGICAISVLSRIESGTCEPTPILFEKLSEKLEMKFPTADRQDPIGLFRMMSYRGDFSEMDQLLQGGDLYDYEKPLLAFLVAVKRGEIKKAEKFKAIVDRWAQHLNPVEAQVYTLFNGKYFFAKCEWEEGVNFLASSYKIAHQNMIHDPFLYLEIGKYYFKIERSHLGFVFLERASALFQKFLAKKLIIECLIIGCDAYIKLGELDEATGKLEQLHHFLELEEDAALANDLLSLSGRIDEWREDLRTAESTFLKLATENKENLSESCLMSIIAFYNRCHQPNRVLAFIDEIEVKQMSAQMQILLEYYYYKATDTCDNDFELFLLDDAIPQAMKHLNVSHVTMYMKALAEFYEVKKRYKGIATTYQELEAFRNRLQKMKTVLVK